ncbi:MAG: MFS transporter [Planctomycetaceae bacterium]|nr:MFS transporter [Planctomycetaceae bacterium]
MSEHLPTTDDAPAAAGWVRHKVMAMLCLAAAIAYISRNSIAVPVELIEEDLGLDERKMGWVMGAFFWSYAFAQIPAGWLGQYWGTRRALSLYAVLWSFASALSGWASGLWSLIAARLLFGIAQAGIFPSSANTIAKWLPNSERGTSSGALGAFMSIGGAISLALTGLLLSGIDWGPLHVPGVSWRGVFFILAAPGVLWAVWFYFWFRDTPQEHSSVTLEELAAINVDAPVESSPTESREPTPWGIILSSPTMWMICGQQAARAAGYIFFVTWFPTYLKEVHGVQMEKAGLLGSVPLFGTVAGALLGGFLVDAIWKRTGSRRLSRQGVAITAMLLSAVFTMLAWFAHALEPAMALIAAGTFAAGLAGSCGYTVTIDKGGNHIGPIFGMMNMAGNLAAALFPVVVGELFARDYYATSLLLVAGIYVTAAVCWMLINPVGTLFADREMKAK